MLEPTEDNTGVKKKGELTLPELEPKLQKKVKKDENGVKNQLADDEDAFDP